MANNKAAVRVPRMASDVTGAMWSTALSDAALAASGAYAASQLYTVLEPTDMGVALVGAAAALGALRFGPLPAVRGAHNFASALATAVGMPALGLGFAVRAGLVPIEAKTLAIYVLAGIFLVSRVAAPRKVTEGLGLVASLGGIGLLGYTGGQDGLIAAGLIVLAAVFGPGIDFLGPLRKVDYFHYLMAVAFYYVQRAGTSW